MATPAQVTASRANAQLSTGPRSVEGKAVASRNSFKLGITAQAMIIPGEDPADLDRLTATYERQFQPVGPVEGGLLETIIRAEWMQRRYARIEAAYVSARVAALPPDTAYPLGAVMVLDAANGNTLNKIFRRQQAAQRDWDRALESLYRLQAHRRRTGSEPVSSRSIASQDAVSGAETDSCFPPPRVRFDNAPQAAGRIAPETPVNLALRL